MEGNPEMPSFENHQVGDCHGDADTNKKEIYYTMCERERKRNADIGKSQQGQPLFPSLESEYSCCYCSC
jgi:hypothetical protein